MSDQPCTCGYADECDGEHAVFLPLGNGGSAAVRPCPRACRNRPEPDIDRYVESDFGDNVQGF